MSTQMFIGREGNGKITRNDIVFENVIYYYYEVT